MSFFKKLTSDFESLMGDDKKKDKHSEERSAPDGYPGYGAPPQGYPPQPQYQQQQPYQQPGYGAPSPAPYGAPSPAPYGAPSPAPYGAPPTPGYGAPPQGYAPQPQYGAPAPSYDQQAYYPPPPFPPPVPGRAPAGWAARFDEQYKQWYYVNEATRVAQWGHPEGAPSTAVVGKSPIPD